MVSSFVFKRYDGKSLIVYPEIKYNLELEAFIYRVEYIL